MTTSRDLTHIAALSPVPADSPVVCCSSNPPVGSFLFPPPSASSSSKKHFFLFLRPHWPLVILLFDAVVQRVLQQILLHSLHEYFFFTNSLQPAS